MASISRRFLNTRLIPQFGEMISGYVLCVGKHLYYDYAHLFPTASYQTLDINPDLKPDIVADIQNSGLPDKSYDGIMFTGMYEIVKDWPKARAELYRILKDNGWILITFAGVGFFLGSTKPEEVFAKVAPFKIHELYVTYYKNGVVEYISTICKK